MSDGAEQFWQAQELELFRQWLDDKDAQREYQIRQLMKQKEAQDDNGRNIQSSETPF